MTMIRAKGRYFKQKVELNVPLAIPDGAEVELEIHLKDTECEQKADWAEFGMSRLEEEWDNAEDAIYDDWRNLYGV
jgi:hypothetical protein